MVFGETGFTPFMLAHVDGLYEHQNNVSISENTMIDGGTYQGMVAQVRNIILTLLDWPNDFYNMYDRNALYVLFGQGKKGTLIYTEDGVSRKIDYYTESVIRSTRDSRAITVSLLCPDPYFYDVEYTEVQMANWEADFEFEHEFVSAGEPLGHRSDALSQTIDNQSASDNIGMNIVLECVGAVTNPSIVRVESNEHITIGQGNSSGMFTMQAGDIVTITTSTGDKHVYLERDGVVQEINGYITEDSTFIQIMRGINTIGYAADSGAENLIITVKYRFKYEGA